ncbi:MAG: methyltransferase domain-containing protein [Arcobacteraceae bacterium]|jgi:2-polyprenyl-3-methyl-5-hydroxy-6-metoxy-1,4-benzoquinol methylase|nr:methyltransferase domain-containing protein [Arcobacteraceae bacterium]
MQREQSVYIGCGNDIQDGFIHVNIRKLDHVDIVCDAWSVSKHLQDINHIYSRHMLEHLTNFEADRALRDWYKALAVGGTIRIIVPNMDFHCKQWLEAEWNEETLRNKHSDAQHSFAGFWGWQAECDPWSDDYNTTYWDVHKSGYSEKRIKLLLKRIGFVNIKTEIKNNWHLVAEATKPNYSGERQVGTNLDEIRKDHLNRYIFASQFITKTNAIVNDGACGVGYGSYILAQNSNVLKVNSLDISQEALSHAKQYFNNDKIEHKICDLENGEISTELCDYFISFETIEHLNDANKLINKISKSLLPNGVFIGSTPNETVMPYSKERFPYHTKHFSIDELKGLLNANGFYDIEFFQQKREEPSEIEEIENGHYIIFVAKKH